MPAVWSSPIASRTPLGSNGGRSSGVFLTVTSRSGVMTRSTSW